MLPDVAYGQFAPEVEAARRGAAEAAKLADSSSSWWAWLINADPTDAALRSAAHAKQVEADAVEGKVRRVAVAVVQGDGVAGDDAADLRRAVADAADNTVLRQTAQVLTVKEAARQTLGLSVIPWWAWLLIVVVLLVVFAPALAFGGAAAKAVR